MATLLNVTSVSPYSAVFDVFLEAGEHVQFKQSGAADPDQDLRVLRPGPLKEYLSRLANWASVATPQTGTYGSPILVWRRSIWSSPDQTPTVGAHTVDAQIVQAGQAVIQFQEPTGASGNFFLELTFRHSATR